MFSDLDEGHANLAARLTHSWQASALVSNRRFRLILMASGSAASHAWRVDVEGNE